MIPESYPIISLKNTLAEGFKPHGTAPIHEDKCAERHIAMYVQQFAHVTPIGKVPRHHRNFKLPWRVLHQYINIATGNVKLPAYDAGYGIPFTARHCPLCEPNKLVCTVYHSG